MNLCGIGINCHLIDDLLKERNSIIQVVTVNAEAVVRAQTDKKLCHIITASLTTIDGQIPLWLYKWLYPQIQIEKISGSDLIYIVAQWANRTRKKIYLLGGNSLSNFEAVEKLKKMNKGIEIEGFSPPFSPYPFSEQANENIMIKIEQFGPDILFVGFGMGKQEYWAYDNIERLARTGVKMIIGCGGTFEFVSGQIKRAPKLVQRIGMEGFWRLFQEFKWFRLKRLLLSFKIFHYYFKYHVLRRKREI